jgi:hypothetical protein
MNRPDWDRELSQLAARRSEDGAEGSWSPGHRHALRLATSRGPGLVQFRVPIHAKQSQEGFP